MTDNDDALIESSPERKNTGLGLFSNIDLPKIEPPQFVVNAEQGIASEFRKRLAKWIQDFDDILDDSHEVGVRLVSFGQTVTFHLENLAHWDPYLISFSGFTQDGNPVELIQHVSQISVLLMKMARKNPDEPKRRIGFAVRNNEDELSEKKIEL